MRNFHELVETVQKNCHIADANHARNLTMCTYLLEMREFFRWENELPSPSNRRAPKSAPG